LPVLESKSGRLSAEVPISAPRDETAEKGASIYLNGVKILIETLKLSARYFGKEVFAPYPGCMVFARSGYMTYAGRAYLVFKDRGTFDMLARGIASTASIPIIALVSFGLAAKMALDPKMARIRGVMPAYGLGEEAPS